MRVLDQYSQLRLGGLPHETANSLQEATFAHNIDFVADAKAKLSANRNVISDQLHDAISQLDADRRRPVIALRRKIYKLNLAEAATALSDLDTETRDLLDQYAEDALSLIQTLGTRLAEISVSFDKALAHERHVISGFASNSQFMAGVSISAPSLVPAIERLSLNIARNAIDRKDKKAERSLHSYIVRAATKTSPFSSLGPVSIVSEQLDGGSACHISRPSLYPIARALNNLLAEPRRLANLNVRISPNARITDSSVDVDRVAWEFKDNNSQTDFAVSTEDIVFIKQKPLTDAVISILGEGTSTLDELARSLSEGSGLGIEAVYDLLGDLLRLGFLDIPTLSFHPYDADLPTVIAEIKDMDTELGEIIADYVTSAEQFAQITSEQERITQISKLRKLVEQMYSKAGVIGRLPRSVVYEDVLVNAARPDEDFGEDISDATANKLLALLDLLDDSNVKHALMVGYFENQHKDTMGAGDFLLGFIDELFDSFEAYELTSIADANLESDPWLRWGEAWRWVVARRTLTAELEAHAAQVELGTTSGPLFALEPLDITEALDHALAGITLSDPTYRHANILAQKGEGSEWIINDAFGGIGFQVSRFTHLVRHEARCYTEDINDLAQEHGVTLAELSGGATFSNLNLHDPILPTALVLPGEPEINGVNEKGIETISLDDLAVSYSQEEKRLVLLRNGSLIHPVYSGYLVPAATPRRNQVLSLFSPSAQMSRKVAEIISKSPKPGSITVFPRMMLDNLVIVRTLVLINARDLPTDSPLTDEGYRAWLRLWVSAGLPMTSFVKVHDDASTSHKPYFFDIRQILSCSTLYNDLCNAEGEAFLELSEVLPESSSYRYEETERVTEQMIGMSWIKESACQS